MQLFFKQNYIKKHYFYYAMYFNLKNFVKCVVDEHNEIFFFITIK